MKAKPIRVPVDLAVQDSPAMRKLRADLMHLHAEQKALAALLIRKGMITAGEYGRQVTYELVNLQTKEGTE